MMKVKSILMITHFQNVKRAPRPKVLKVGQLKGSSPEHPMTGSISFEKKEGSIKLYFSQFRSVPGHDTKVFLGTSNPDEPETLLGYLPQTHGSFYIEVSLNIRFSEDSRVNIRTGKNRTLLGFALLKKPLRVIKQS